MDILLLEKIYYRLGALICHQITSRTLVVDGKYLPVCARDTGIYLGMFLSLVFLYLSKRWDCDKPPRLSLTIILCAFIVFMGWDGITSYLQIRTTNNMVRLISGGLFGMAIPFFLMPIANFKIFNCNKNPALGTFKELIILALLLVLVCMTIYYGLIKNWWLISSIIIFTMLFIYYRICYSITVQVFKTAKINQLFISLLLEILIFTCLYLFSEYILAPIKEVNNLL